MKLRPSFQEHHVNLQLRHQSPLNFFLSSSHQHIWRCHWRRLSLQNCTYTNTYISRDTPYPCCHYSDVVFNANSTVTINEDGKNGNEKLKKKVETFKAKGTVDARGVRRHPSFIQLANEVRDPDTNRGLMVRKNFSQQAVLTQDF